MADRANADNGCTAPSASRSRAGFTLVEMMVTMGIILIAFGFLAPSLANAFQKRKLSNACDIVVRKLNEARDNAVNRKQAYSVVFVRSGVRLYREAKATDPGGWEGGVEPFEPDGVGAVTYDLQFAGERGLGSEDIPEITGTIEEGTRLLEAGEIFLRYQPDGSVDFNRNRDISSSQYEEGTNADIVFHQAGLEWARGLIDVRVTGRAKSQVKEIDDEE